MKTRVARELPVVCHWCASKQGPEQDTPYFHKYDASLGWLILHIVVRTEEGLVFRRVYKDEMEERNED